MGLGDDLMVTGHIRKMQLTDPRRVRIEYGKVGGPLWSKVFDHNPRIARARDKDVQVYHARVDGLRPYCAKKTYEKWTWKDYTPEVGEFFFQPDELAFAASVEKEVDVVIEPNIKNAASPNKRWYPGYWETLVSMMRSAGIVPTQFGPVGTPIVSGARFIETRSFRWAAVALSKARAAVLTEGGMHHAAAAVGVPAVVIYGGFISPRQTGYSLHTNLFTGGNPCGNRVFCAHCEEAMRAITPKMVLQELVKILDRRSE